MLTVVVSDQVLFRIKLAAAKIHWARIALLLLTLLTQSKPSGDAFLQSRRINLFSDHAIRLLFPEGECTTFVLRKLANVQSLPDLSRVVHRPL